MWILNGDGGVGLGLLKTGEWQRDDFNAAINIISKSLNGKRNSIFLDIGANIGTHSIYAALSTQFREIVAIEPEPRNIRLLKENLSLNELYQRPPVLTHGDFHRLLVMILLARGDSRHAVTNQNAHRLFRPATACARQKREDQ